MDRLEEKANERTARHAEARAARESQKDIKQVLSAMKQASGDDIYKLRAKVADRIRSICVGISVAPLGHGRMVSEEMQRLLEKQARRFAPVLDSLEQRAFSVTFKDGSVRMVRVSDDDPLRFEVQLYGDAAGLHTSTSSGAKTQH